MSNNPFELGPIESWIEGFDLEGALARIGEIKSQIDALGEEQGRLEAAIAFKERWDHAHPDLDRPPPRRMRAAPDAHIPLDSPIPIRGKTDGALRVLGSDPDREWNAYEIGQELIERGLMEDSESEYASLASTLSRLYSEGKIHRPYRGHYRLSPPTKEPDR
jgi:hypothetical protein